MTTTRTTIGRNHPLMRKIRSITRKHSGIVYTGHETVTAHGYWDSGSRYQLWMFDLVSGKVAPVPMVTAPAQFGGGATVAAPEGNTAIVSCGTFCGKPGRPHIYLPDGWTADEESLTHPSAVA